MASPPPALDSGWGRRHPSDKDVEIEVGVHPAGEERATWSTDEYRTAVLLLVRGRFRVNLSAGSFVLQNQGDYVISGAGIDHIWHADEDSVVITLRWPSMPE